MANPWTQKGADVMFVDRGRMAVQKHKDSNFMRLVFINTRDKNSHEVDHHHVVVPLHCIKTATRRHVHSQDGLKKGEVALILGQYIDTRFEGYETITIKCGRDDWEHFVEHFEKWVSIAYDQGVGTA
jgi:hypothetical protein